MAFSHSMAVSLSAVLEDTVNQLGILGKIMPVSLQAHPEANKFVQTNITSMISSQLEAERTMEAALSARTEGKDSGLIQEFIGNLTTSNRLVDQSMRQNPLTKDNLQKIQEDRQFCEDVLAEVYKEMQAKHSFQSLLKAVKMEKDRKLGLQRTIIKEEQGRRKIKQLQRQLQDIKKEKELEIQQRNEMIAHLKDQLQEMKAKSNMEGKYVKKNAENQVHQNQQHCQIQEQTYKDELEELKRKVDEEVRTHVGIEEYLKKHQTMLEEKVEHWMDKYDKDVDAKQQELSTLKSSKANDLERLQELTRKY
uniref:Dynein regulatory complex protein 10 n=1 Tax=Ciona savignyi TaxID=51511 RepID=H2ZA23_CIOSA